MMKLLGKESSSSDENILSDESCSTELTMTDIKEQIEAVKQKITELERENDALKFTLDNIAHTDKKSGILYILDFQVVQL